LLQKQEVRGRENFERTGQLVGSIGGEDRFTRIEEGAGTLSGGRLYKGQRRRRSLTKSRKKIPYQGVSRSCGLPGKREEGEEEESRYGNGRMSKSGGKGR